MTSFGSKFCETMAIAWFKDGAWEPFSLEKTEPLALHPAAHVFHYASTCFEGFKAYRSPDGKVRIFRLKKHIARMQQSAKAMYLPEPDPDAMREMVYRLVRENRDDIPEPPGALYVRPALIGTMPNIGAAAVASDQACLFVLVSPVGDYFAGGLNPLRILVDDEHMRTTPQLGMAKTGGNYAAALGTILAARRDFNADQVLFCPAGDVQETGAANFLMLNDQEILTKQLDASFLHGVTRESVLTLGGDLGYRITERNITVEELLEWAKSGEAALSGTAAVLAPVGTLIYKGAEIPVGTGTLGKNTERLRSALVDIQCGRAEDAHGWLELVD